MTVYAVDAIAAPPKCVSASPTTPGPSMSSDNTSIGSGTNRLPHTVNPRPDAPAQRREATLPAPQLSAPARHSRTPTSGVAPERPRATTKSPPTAMPMPMSWMGRGRSPRTAAAMTTVNSA